MGFQKKAFFAITVEEIGRKWFEGPTTRASNYVLYVYFFNEICANREMEFATSELMQTPSFCVDLRVETTRLVHHWIEAMIDIGID